MGSRGETFAVSLLESNGYKVIERNFRCKFGEIDIIAQKDGILIYVEVKTRKSFKFGLPEEAVTKRKIRKIARIGELYQKIHPKLPKKLRIDVVSVLLRDGVVARAKIIKVL